MNWKSIIGVLIILGSVKEFFAVTTDYKNGITKFNPIYVQIACLAFALLGAYLIYNNLKKKTL
jgi:hypothetical protein